MEHLRFGTYLSPVVLPLYQAIADAVGRALGVTTELVVESDYAACVHAVNDVCFVCSLPYVLLERQGYVPATPVAAPVLSGARYGGRPVYYSDVIVRQDRAFASFLDLRGSSWAYNEASSHSGYGMTRYHLLELGETNGFFGHVAEVGSHTRSIEMVRTGEADAAAIDSHLLDIYRRNDPDLDRELRVVAQLGPSTIQPIAVARHVDEGTRNGIVATVLGLHHDPLVRPHLEAAGVERFVAVGPETYDDIRHMVDACEAAGFTEIR